MSNYKTKKNTKMIVSIIAFALISVLVIGLGVHFFGLKEKLGFIDYTINGFTNDTKAEYDLKTDELVFNASVSNSLKKKVEKDKNKSFGMLIAPKSYFLAVDTENKFHKNDWITEFKKLGYSFTAVDGLDVKAETSASGRVESYHLEAGLKEIPYENVNQSYIAVGYVKTVNDKESSYEYAGYDFGFNYRTLNNSLSYAVGDLLNDIVINDRNVSEQDQTKLASIINKSVDLANGEAVESADNSKFIIKLSDDVKYLKARQSFDLTAEISPKVIMPIWYKSNDESIVKVDNGKVTAVADGTAVVSVYVAGQKTDCTVVVNKDGVEPTYNIIYKVSDGTKEVGTWNDWSFMLDKNNTYPTVYKKSIGVEIKGLKAGQVTKPDTTEKYTFGGYFTDVACKEAFDGNIAKGEIGDKTIYAKITKVA